MFVVANNYIEYTYFWFYLEVDEAKGSVNVHQGENSSMRKTKNK